MEDILDIIEDTCPECGSTDVFRDSSDYIQCNNCGYEEVSVMGVCDFCGEEVPIEILQDGLCPACAGDDVYADGEEEY